MLGKLEMVNIFILDFGNMAIVGNNQMQTLGRGGQSFLVGARFQRGGAVLLCLIAVAAVMYSRRGRGRNNQNNYATENSDYGSIEMKQLCTHRMLK